MKMRTIINGICGFQRWALCATALALGILDDTTLHAQPGSLLWLQRYSDETHSKSDARSIAIDADGNVIVAGVIYSASAYSDWLVVKYSNAGLLLWTNRYNGPGDANDQANAVALDPNGTVFVTGYSDVVGIRCFDCYPSLDYTTIAYSKDGVPLWTNRFGGPVELESNDEAVAIAVDAHGDVVVAGVSARDAYFYDWVTIKYSNAGVPLWTNRYNSTNTAAHARALAVD